MSQADVSYSCGSCGYPLHLTSSNRIASGFGISSEYSKSVKKGLISFLSVDLSRFTQVDEVHCFPVSWGRYRLKTKLLCRKCGVHIGYGYGDAPALCGFDSPESSGAAYKKFTTLCLDCCFRISGYGISLVGDGCPSLSTLSLYRCNITDTGLEALANACLALRCMNLAYCPHISDSGLSALSQGCCELQTIKISNCKGVTGVGLRGCSSTLVYVDADFFNLEPEGIMSIVSGGGLKFLNFAGLSCSKFRNGLETNGKGLETIGNGFAAGLKTLSLRMCRSVTDASVVAITKGCPQLQEWNLAMCHEIRVAGWFSIGSDCHNLEKLHVNRCRNLCNQGLQRRLQTALHFVHEP
ncbi:hypothetical protein V6N13_071753 [Hibiscus sabdariffa]